MFQHPWLVLCLKQVVMIVNISEEIRILTVQIWGIEEFWVFLKPSPAFVVGCCTSLGKEWTHHCYNKNIHEWVLATHSMKLCVRRSSGRKRRLMTEMSSAIKRHWIPCVCRATQSHTRGCGPMWLYSESCFILV